MRSVVNCEPSPQKTGKRLVLGLGLRLVSGLVLGSPISFVPPYPLHHLLTCFVSIIFFTLSVITFLATSFVPFIFFISFIIIIVAFFVISCHLFRSIHFFHFLHHHDRRLLRFSYLFHLSSFLPSFFIIIILHLHHFINHNIVSFVFWGVSSSLVFLTIFLNIHKC